MLTGRRFWTFAMVFVLAIVTVTAGCRRRSGSRTTINNSGSDIFTTDAFPGDDVQQNNVADDKRALSPSGDDFSGGLRCTMNGSRGTAMITYQMDDGAVAQYYDGAQFTPPVALRSTDSQNTHAFSYSDIIHAFINTEEHASDNARERNGDCLIIWRTSDFDTDGAGADGDNVNIEMTYFDVTNIDNAGLWYGFQQYSTRINSQIEVGEDVDTIGLVTDGLCSEARWFDGFNEYEYGDTTTSIEVVYRQRENNDADAAVEDTAVYSARIDLTVTGDPSIPLPVAVLSRFSPTGFGASDGGTDSEETQPFEELISYNNVLFYIARSNDALDNDTPVDGHPGYPGNGADDDIILNYHQYDLSTGSVNLTGIETNPGVNDSTADGFENNAFFLFDAVQFVYGPDEGLANMVIFFLMFVENDVNGADADNSGNLWIAEIDVTDGSLDSVAQIGTDDVTIVDTIFDGDVDTRISRNGDYIWVVWIQPEDVVGIGGPGLFAASYVTTRPDEDGTFILPSIVDSLSTDILLDTSDATETIRGFDFQECLGYICGAQSNADIMSIFYRTDNDVSASTIDTILQAELTADLVLPTSPTAFVATFEVYEIFDQGFFFNDGRGMFNDWGSFRATDSGFDGFVFAAYSDDVDGTGTDDYRGFAERTGPFSAGVVQIDSAVFFRQVDGSGFFGNSPFSEELICLPPGQDIGRFDTVSLEDDEQRHHGNDRIHTFFKEHRDTETIGNFALRTREFVTADNGNTMGDNFLPNAGTVFVEPFTFGLPGVEEQAFIVGTARCDGTVGIWYEHQSRLYYQENSSSAEPNDSDVPEQVGWLTQGDPGINDPHLIDDDQNEEINGFEEFCVYSCTCCDLDGAMIFWSKDFGGSSSNRLQVRVRNGGGEDD